MIDYKQVAEPIEESEYPVLSAGDYVCKITSMVYEPDNEYDGKPSPCYTLKFKPMFNFEDPESVMKNTDGKEWKNEYVNKETQYDMDNVIFYSLPSPLKAVKQDGTPTKFGNFIKAIIGTENFQKMLDGKYTPAYTEPSDFVGDTVVCEIVSYRTKAGKLRNKITAVRKHADNKIKTEADIKRSDSKSEVMSDAEKKINELSIDDIPATS